METKICHVRIKPHLREDIEEYQKEIGARDFSKALNDILEKFFSSREDD